VETPSTIKRLLTRCNIVLDHDLSNARIAEYRKTYDIISLRPVDEKTLTSACQTLDTDLISLDLSIRYPFHFKFKMVGSALERGIKFEISYGQGVLKDGESRRNVMQNAAALIRSLRGRGIIISSEGNNALACRAPHDIINLAVIWGLKQDVATEAITDASRSVVAAAQLRKRSFKGAVDVISVPKALEEVVSDKTQKRKAPASEQQSKKQAKKAKAQAADTPKQTPSK
jgi:ribonuclease P/MRP protein subunit RPP1